PPPEHYTTSLHDALPISPEEAGLRHLPDHRIGRHRDGAFQGREAARPAVVVDAGRIGVAHAAQQPERLLSLLRQGGPGPVGQRTDRKSTRLSSSHVTISY